MTKKHFNAIAAAIKSIRENTFGADSSEHPNTTENSDYDKDSG